MTQQDSVVKFSSIFSSIPKFVTTIATVTLCASILHEYTYFRIVGPELLSIYSPSDFLKLTIYWIPFYIVLTSFGMILNYWDIRARLAAFAVDPVAASATYKNPDRFNRWNQYFICGIALISIPYVSMQNLSAIQIPIYIAILFLIGKLVESGRLPFTDRPAEALILYVGMALLFTNAAFSGFSAGVSDLKKSDPLYMIKTSSIDGEYVLLKTLDKGIMFKEPKDSIVYFSPWDDVKQVRSASITVSSRSLLDYVKSWFI